jgi:hypothetical protein
MRETESSGAKPGTTMAKIHLTIEDENGQQSVTSFELHGDLESLDGIDEAVESFSQEALPQIESHLLGQAQTRAVEAAKKKTL